MVPKCLQSFVVAREHRSRHRDAQHRKDALWFLAGQRGLAKLGQVPVGELEMTASECLAGHEPQPSSRFVATCDSSTIAASASAHRPDGT